MLCLNLEMFSSSDVPHVVPDVLGSGGFSFEVQGAAYSTSEPLNTHIAVSSWCTHTHRHTVVATVVLYQPLSGEAECFCSLSVCVPHANTVI